jgi:hypothetical protein
MRLVALEDTPVSQVRFSMINNNYMSKVQTSEESGALITLKLT